VRRFIYRIDYFKSILRVIGKYPEIIEGKTDLTAAAAKLAANTDRLSEIASGLVYPYTFIQRERVTLRKSLQDEVRRMSYLGCLVASKHNDPVLLSKMKEYRAITYKISTYKLYVSAYDIADVLDTYVADDGLTIGFTAKEIESLRLLATQLSTSLSDARGQLEDRRTNKNEAKTLFKNCTSILKESFDPYVQACKASIPDFATAYLTIRNGVGKSKKATANATAEISGTVTDAADGEPIVNATVTLPDFNLTTTTDEDGCFVFDELPLTSFKVGCSATDYEVPQPQNVTLAAGDSCTVDFFLNRVQKAE
jgi:hypothetical protein